MEFFSLVFVFEEGGHLFDLFFGDYKMLFVSIFVAVPPNSGKDMVE